MKSKEMKTIELVIGKILRIGVVISVTVMLLGLILFLWQQSGGYPHNRFPTSPAAIYQGLLTLKPYAVMMLGIFLLILTPVLRVVVSIYAFWKEHDQLYVYITTTVLIILVVAMVGGYWIRH